MVKPTYRASARDKQVRSQLSKLKKLGLYKGNLSRHKPTKYGRSIAKKYEDVLAGKAHIVTVPKRSAAREFNEVYRTVGKKVIVPKERGGGVARYAPKQKTIQITKKNREGERYTRRAMKLRPTKISDLPNLKANQSYRVPFNRWGETVYMYFTDKEELNKLIQEYASKYSQMLGYVEIVSFKAARRDQEDADL